MVSTLDSIAEYDLAEPLMARGLLTVVIGDALRPRDVTAAVADSDRSRRADVGFADVEAIAVGAHMSDSPVPERTCSMSAAGDFGDQSRVVTRYDVKFLKGRSVPLRAAAELSPDCNPGYSEKNPHAREARASEYVPTDDITAIAAEVTDGKTFDQVVDAWWDQNKDPVDRWSVMAAQ